MPQTLTCPRCQTSLTIADAAPNSITCPRCLTQIDRTAYLELASHPALAPRPVLSVETEAKRSTDTGMLVIAAVVIAVLIGLCLQMANAGGNQKSAYCVFAAVAIFAPGLLALVAHFRPRSRSVTTDTGPPPLPGDLYAGTNILPYARAQPSAPRATRVVARLTYFAMGFFFSIGMCIAGAFAMVGRDGQPSKDEKPFVLAIVAAIVVAAAVFGWLGDRRFRWHGFGPGSTVGLVLGCLALGPLAFCYMIV